MEFCSFVFHRSLLEGVKNTLVASTNAVPAAMSFHFSPREPSRVDDVDVFDANDLAVKGACDLARRGIFVQRRQNASIAWHVTACTGFTSRLVVRHFSAFSP